MGFYYNGRPVGNFKTFIGGLLLIPVIAFLIDLLPWRIIFICIIGLVVLWFIICLIWNFIDKVRGKSDK